jgi:hypothetical protein
VIISAAVTKIGNESGKNNKIIGGSGENRRNSRKTRIGGRWLSSYQESRKKINQCFFFISVLEFPE